MRLLFAVLLFIAGCGGGSEGNTGNPAPVNPDEIPSVPSQPPTVATPTTGTDDFCSLVTRVAPLPRGSYPSWLVNGINASSPAADGAFLNLDSDGTLYGNFGRNADISVFVETHDLCRVGTRPPAYAGHWVYTSDECFCQRWDITPSFVLCIYGLDVDSETACSHHESRPTLGTEQASTSLRDPDDYVPDWYEVDIEGLIEEIPQASEQVSDILTELE